MEKKQKKYLSGKDDMPSIGALLTEYIEHQRIYQAALARDMQRNITTIVSYKKRHSIQAGILWELSHVLQHNFFADLAVRLPDTFTGALAALKTEHMEAIARMEEATEKLQRENLLLRELLRERR